MMNSDTSWFEEGQNHFRNQPSISGTQRGSRPPDVEAREEKPDRKDIIEEVCLVDDEDDAEEAVNSFHSMTRKKILLPFTGAEIQEEFKFLEAIRQFRMILEEKVEVLTLKKNLKEMLYKYLLFFGTNYERIGILYKDQYLDVMEDILLFYCDVIKEFFKERRGKKAKIIQEARRMKILLRNCLLKKMDRIMHVLLKVRLAPEMEECRLLWGDVYMYFLTKVPYKYADDDILRGYIAFQKFKTIRVKSEAPMIDQLMLGLYKKSTEELRWIPCLGEIMDRTKRDRLYTVRDMVTRYMEYYKERRSQTECFGIDDVDEGADVINVNPMRRLDLAGSFPRMPASSDPSVTQIFSDRRRGIRKTVLDLAAESTSQMDQLSTDFSLFGDDLPKAEPSEDPVVVLDDEDEDDDVIVVCDNLKTVITIDDDDDEPVQIQPTKSPPPREALSPDRILHPPDSLAGNRPRRVADRTDTAPAPRSPPDPMEVATSTPPGSPASVENSVPDDILPPQMEKHLPSRTEPIDASPALSESSSSNSVVVDPSLPPKTFTMMESSITGSILTPEGKTSSSETSPAYAMEVDYPESSRSSPSIENSVPESISRPKESLLPKLTLVPTEKLIQTLDTRIPMRQVKKVDNSLIITINSIQSKVPSLGNDRGLSQVELSKIPETSSEIPKKSMETPLNLDIDKTSSLSRETGRTAVLPRLEKESQEASVPTRLEERKQESSFPSRQKDERREASVLFRLQEGRQEASVSPMLEEERQETSLLRLEEERREASVLPRLEEERQEASVLLRLQEDRQETSVPPRLEEGTQETSVLPRLEGKQEASVLSKLEEERREASVLFRLQEGRQEASVSPMLEEERQETSLPRLEEERREASVLPRLEEERQEASVLLGLQEGRQETSVPPRLEEETQKTSVLPRLEGKQEVSVLSKLEEERREASVLLRLQEGRQETSVPPRLEEEKQETSLLLRLQEERQETSILPILEAKETTVPSRLEEERREASVVPRLKEERQGTSVLPMPEEEIQESSVIPMLEEKQEASILPRLEEKGHEASVLPRLEEDGPQTSVLPRLEERRQQASILPRLEEDRQEASVLPRLGKEREESLKHQQSAPEEDLALKSQISPSKTAPPETLNTDDNDSIPKTNSYCAKSHNKETQPMEIEDEPAKLLEKADCSIAASEISSENNSLNQTDGNENAMEIDTSGSLERVANSTMNEDMLPLVNATYLSPITKEDANSKGAKSLMSSEPRRIGVLPSSKIPSDFENSPTPSPEKNAGKSAVSTRPHNESETSDISSPPFESIDKTKVEKYFQSIQRAGRVSSSTETDTSTSNTSSGNSTATSNSTSVAHITAESSIIAAPDDSELTSSSEESDFEGSSLEESREISQENTVIQVEESATKSHDLVEPNEDSPTTPHAAAPEPRKAPDHSQKTVNYSNLTECFTKFVEELSVEDMGSSHTEEEEEEDVPLSTIDLVPATDNANDVILIKCRPIEPLKDEENTASGAESVAFSADEVLGSSQEAVALLVTYPGSSQEESQHFLMCNASLALAEDPLAFSSDEVPPGSDDGASSVSEHSEPASVDIAKIVLPARRITVDGPLSLSGSQPYTPQSSPSSRIDTVKHDINKFVEGPSALEPCYTFSEAASCQASNVPQESPGNHLSEGKNSHSFSKPLEEISTFINPVKRSISTDSALKPQRNSCDLSQAEGKNYDKGFKNATEDFRENLSQSITTVTRVTPQEVDRIAQLPFKYSQQSWSDKSQQSVEVSQPNLLEEQFKTEKPAPAKFLEPETTAPQEKASLSQQKSSDISQFDVTLSQQTLKVATPDLSLVHTSDKQLNGLSYPAMLGEDKLNELYLKEYGNTLSQSTSRLSQAKIQSKRRHSQEALSPVRSLKIYAKDKPTKDLSQPKDRDMSLKSYKSLIKSVSKRRTSVLRDLESPSQKEEGISQSPSRKLRALEDISLQKDDTFDHSDLFNSVMEGPIGKPMVGKEGEDNFFWDSDSDNTSNPTFSGTISVKPDSQLYQAKKGTASPQKNAGSGLKSLNNGLPKQKSPDKKKDSVPSKAEQGLYVKLTPLDIDSYRRKLNLENEMRKRQMHLANELKKKQQIQLSLAQEMKAKQQQSLQRDQILIQIYSGKSEPTSRPSNNNNTWFAKTKAARPSSAGSNVSSRDESHFSKGKVRDEAYHRNGHRVAEKRKNRDFEPEGEIPKKKIAVRTDLMEKKPKNAAPNGKIITPKLKSIIKTVKVSSPAASSKGIAIEGNDMGEAPSSPVKTTKSGRVCKKPRPDYDDLIRSHFNESGKVKKSVRFKL